MILFRQKMKNLDLPKAEAIVRLACADRPRRVTVRRIDEDHGNPLKLWEAMGRPDALNPAEVEALKDKSAVRPETWPFTWEDGVLTGQGSARRQRRVRLCDRIGQTSCDHESTAGLSKRQAFRYIAMPARQAAAETWS